ncbi:GATOR complex protein NPRL2 [Eumeta japonica]|uniref:GATOR complex protein NPRL2 n=1 Tax=Eumeta variegata TaxID=151549 RepID=A0A4C1U3V8_EUMVA|nr:GATOR complex protein NPRL2 [Eumeta japonica]
MDGFNHVSKIAALSDVEVSLVRACVQNLVYYGVVTLVPLFQYCAVYSATPKLRQLTRCTALQRAAVQFCARTRITLPDLPFALVFLFYTNTTLSVTSFTATKTGVRADGVVIRRRGRALTGRVSAARQLPKVSDVFRMYAGMTYGTTVRDLCLRLNPHALGINERKLVLFGVLEGLIRRIYKFKRTHRALRNLLRLPEDSSKLSRRCGGGATADQKKNKFKKVGVSGYCVSLAMLPYPEIRREASYFAALRTFKWFIFVFWRTKYAIYPNRPESGTKYDTELEWISASLL